MAEREGTRRGRPILVAARVPMSVIACRNVGIDIERWLREDLLDLMILGNGETWPNLPVEEFVKLGHEYNVPVYPCLKYSGYGHDDIETWRAAASNAWRTGADGMYFFNHAPHLDASPQFKELGDPEKLAPLVKLFAATDLGTNWPYIQTGQWHLGLAFVLPSSLPALLKAEGEETVVSMDIGDDIAGAAKRKILESAVMKVRLSDANLLEEVETRLNGRLLTPTATDTEGGWLTFNPEPAWYRMGENRVVLRLTKALDVGGTPAQVLAVETVVKYSPPVIARDGKTAYRIVIPRGSDRSTMAVALDLAAILKESTGVVFPVYMDDYIDPGESEIVIGGDNARLAQLGLADLVQGFSPGEYKILTHGTYIVIAGAPPRGTINGVYGFLQDYLGCRWLTPGCQYVPKHSSLTLGEIQDRQKPAFRWRGLSPSMSWDATWYVRNRLNESKVLSGGPRPSSIMQLHADPRTATMANSWTPHAFQDIPDTLYREHPEWYAEIDGKRVLGGDPAHIYAVVKSYCITNDDFAHWFADWTRDRLRTSPQPMKFIGITHADTDRFCQCGECQASYDRVGISGTYMQFANKVAEQVAKEFPETQLVMLAYYASFEPNPVKLHPNVMIVWCPIRACWAHALDECEYNGPTHLDYVGKLDRWLENTDQLGIWYYQDSEDAPMPRPTFAAMQRNLRLFRDRNVDQVGIEMIFNKLHKNTSDTDGDKTMPAYAASEDYYSRQGAYGSWVFSYGFDHLRGYIGSRMLWNPDFDWQQGIREFCDIYYGDAGKEVAEYLLEVEQLSAYDKSYNRPGNEGEFSVLNYPGIHMHFYPAPRLKLSLAENFDALFGRAEANVKDDPMLLRRVQMGRMSVDFSLLVSTPPDHPLRQKAFDRFFALVEEIGIATSYSGINYAGGRATFAELKKRFSDPSYKPL